MSHDMPISTARQNTRDQRIRELLLLYTQIKQKIDELEVEEKELALEARKVIDEVKIQEILTKLKKF